MRGKYAVCSAILLLNSIVYADYWVTECIDSIGKIGVTNCILQEENGDPHVFYQKDDGLIQHAVRRNELWEIETLDQVIANSIGMSCAIDSANRLYVCYPDLANSQLKCAIKDNGIGSIEIIDSASFVGTISMEVDSLNQPHVVFAKGFNEYFQEIVYAARTGTVWNISTLDICSNPGYLSLAIDSLNRPHLCFYDMEETRFRYAFLDGMEWIVLYQTEVINYGFYSSMAVNALNQPVIVCSTDEMNSYAMNYLTFDSDIWRTRYIDPQNAAREISLCLDSMDLPHIAYASHLESPLLKYATWNWDSWLIETPCPQFQCVMFPAITIGKDGIPKISFLDMIKDAVMYTYRVQGPEPTPQPTAAPDYIYMDSFESAHVYNCTGPFGDEGCQNKWMTFDPSTSYYMPACDGEKVAWHTYEYCNLPEGPDHLMIMNGFTNPDHDMRGYTDLKVCLNWYLNDNYFREIAEIWIACSMLDDLQCDHLDLPWELLFHDDGEINSEMGDCVSTCYSISESYNDCPHLIVALRYIGGNHTNSIAIDALKIKGTSRTPVPETPTPEPTPTPTVAPWTERYGIEMPDQVLRSGMRLSLQRYCLNTLDRDVSVEEYIVLDIYGQYWFWPGWTTDLDCWIWKMPENYTGKAQIIAFDWPDIAGRLSDIYFHGGLIDPVAMELLGYDSIQGEYR